MNKKKINKKLNMSLIVLITCVFSSILTISIISNTNTEYKSWKSETNYDDQYKQANILKFPQTSSNGIINESNRNILYWIQVSDIHISMEYQSHLDKFNEFCSDINSTINPAFVISTGDNVDGRNPIGKQTFNQNPDEFIYFNQTINNNNLSDIWYAVPGNHDTYNTLDDSMFENYTRNESMYSLVIDTSFGKYRFLMLDTTLKPGLTSPFNYWGEFKNDKLNLLENIIENSGDSSDQDEFNQTIAFGHHPLNQISSEKSDSGKDLEDLFIDSKTSFYLSGHIHYPGYSRKDYIYDLMTGSFTYNNYRICAIDNDIFSFSEEKLNEWPAVTITNPTDSRFYSDKQNLNGMVEQNEIRVLIFDKESINSAYAEIDGEIIGNLTNQGNNLWSVNYNPLEYNIGAHTLKIIVSSDSGDTIRELDFNLSDFEPTKIGGFWKYVNGPSARIGFIILVIIFMFIAVGNIFIPKLWFKLSPEASRKYDLDGFDENHGHLKRILIKPISQAATLPKSVSLPLLIMPIYLLFGPIIIGPLLLDEYGIMWLTKITLGEYYLLDISGFMYSLLFLLDLLIFEYYIIRNSKNRVGLLGVLPLLIHLAAIGGLIWFYAHYFGLYVTLMNPIHWINVILTLYYLYKIVEGKDLNTGERKKGIKILF